MPTQILVVDDESDLELLIRNTFRSKIKTGDWTFIFVRDGIEAMERLDQDEEIDFVLTDINMPRMDGLTLLKHIQAMNRPIKTVVVSAYGDMVNIRKAMNRGAFDFVTKPIHLEDLETTIRKTELEVRNLKAAEADQRQLEVIRQELEMTREQEAMKTRFFADLTHEFRTPLTLILNPLKDVLEGRLGAFSDAMQDRFRIMHNHASRLHQLVNQLLDLTKLEAGHLKLHVRRIDLCAWVRSVVHSFIPEAERQKIELQFMPELSDAFCFIDPNQFEKVLVNLLSNALKFTPENGRIKASVDSYDETYLRVTVRDNGGGIRETDLPHVFDRFSSRNHVSHQTSADAGHMTPGTGIGLSLSKNLVERHGGTIHVESEWGFGSKFSILVRRGNDHFSPDELASEDDALTDTPFPFALPSVSTRTIECDVEDTDPKTSTLLLVEDNEDVRSYIRSCLETEYQVFEAGDGQEALEMIASNPPDLIISDIMMPRMDGLALCRALKTSKQWNHIPILLLTAQAGDEQKLEGLATRADDYVLKPFDSRELLLRVENLIRLRQLLQSRFSKAVVFEATRTEVQSADDEFLDRVRHCMEAGLSDPDFEVADVADQVGLSPRQFRRKIRSLTSVSPSGLLQSLRLQRAAQLLEQNFGTVAEVAYAVGYQQVRYFSRLFRHAYGVSPSEYGKDGEIIF